MIPDIGERKMKKKRIIAMLLGTALLVCGCQQTSKATDEEKKIESEKNTTKTEENAYQGKLDLITPAAYNNTDGLKLKKGDYISIIGKANGTQYWDEVKKGVAQAAEDINTNLGYTGKDKVKVAFNAPDTADNVDDQVNLLDEELDRYPVAVGISIVDLQACQVQFDLATDSEIPIVTFDSGSDYQGVAADVSTDNVAAGKEAAQRLAEEMGRQRRSGAVHSGFQITGSSSERKSCNRRIESKSSEYFSGQCIPHG